MVQGFEEDAENGSFFDSTALEYLAASVVGNLLGRKRRVDEFEGLELLAANVRIKRQGQGLNRESLAEAIGKDIGYVILLECGLLYSADVDELTILKLSRVLHCDRAVLEALISQD